MEMNPIARVMMQRIGIKGTIWLIFVTTIIVTILCQVWIQLTTESILWDYIYLLTGTFTVTVQGATALNNHQGRPNFVTKQLFRLISKRAYVIILMFASVLPSCSPSDEPTLLETQGCSQGTAVEEKVQEKIGEGTKWIKEELSVDIEISEFFMTVEHSYPDFHLVMHVYRCHLTKGEVILNEHADLKWLKVEELDQLDWAEADIPIVQRLMCA